MRRTISVAAAAGAASASLFLGAGTAQADISASADPVVGGVAISVTSTAGSGPQLSGACLFTQTVQGPALGRPLPTVNLPFFLPREGPATIRLPGYKTGSTWNIKVNCPGAGARTAQYTTVVW